MGGHDEQKYSLLEDEEGYHRDTSTASKCDPRTRYRNWVWILFSITLAYALLLTGYVLHPNQKKIQLPWSKYPLFIYVTSRVSDINKNLSTCT